MYIFHLTLGQVILIKVLEGIFVLHGKISQLLDHLVGSLSLGQLLALPRSCLCVLALDDTVDGEHSLVRQTFFMRQFICWRRPPKTLYIITLY